eukprot:1159440-Pelagomonas_calceolata.AAC.12
MQAFLHKSHHGFARHWQACSLGTGCGNSSPAAPAFLLRSNSCHSTQQQCRPASSPSSSSRSSSSNKRRGLKCRAEMERMRLLGVGSAAPPTVLTNDDLATLVDTNDEWISTRTGIRRRRAIFNRGSRARCPSR